MRDFLASHVRTMPKSGIRDFFAIVSQLKDAVSLGIGEPDFVTPFHIRDAAISALERGHTSYTDNRGLIALRKEISKYVAANYGEYDPETEIITTVGVSEALDAVLRAILNPGDKVIYHEPCYVSYCPSIRLCHAEAIAVETKAEDDFAITIEALRAAWRPGVKALLINFPTKPPRGNCSRKSRNSPSKRTCSSFPTKFIPS